MAVPSKKIYSPLENNCLSVDREYLTASLSLIYPQIRSHADQWVTLLINHPSQTYSLGQEFGGPFIAKAPFSSLYLAVKAYQEKIMKQETSFLLDFPVQIRTLERMVTSIKSFPPDPALHFLALTPYFNSKKPLVNA